MTGATKCDKCHKPFQVGDGQWHWRDPPCGNSLTYHLCDDCNAKKEQEFGFKNHPVNRDETRENEEQYTGEMVTPSMVKAWFQAAQRRKAKYMPVNDTPLDEHVVAASVNKIERRRRCMMNHLGK